MEPLEGGESRGTVRIPGQTEASEEQIRIRERLILHRTLEEQEIHRIGGADAAYMDGEVIAAVVILTYPGGEEITSSVTVARDSFPYIPGLFAFREGEAILAAFQLLACRPDLIFFHGHGVAHPRRCGLASHLGVLLDLPSIGVASRLLVGTTGPLGLKRGDTAPLIEADEVIGMAVRTRERARQVYVSIGHKTDLLQAVDLVLATSTQHRMPEPLRRADQMARAHRAMILQQR